MDKRLDGVQAVQTLSRLNRLIPGKGAPSYSTSSTTPKTSGRRSLPTSTRPSCGRGPTRTSWTAETRTRRNLRLPPNEVDAFARAFYTPAGNNRMGSHARLQAHLQPARDRFGRLSDDEQAEFTDRVGAFVNLYAFLSQIIPYADSELEQLSAFGRALLPYLRADRQRETVRLGDAVELEYYRLQQVSSGTIQLGEDDDADVVGPSAVGTGTSEEPTAPLSGDHPAAQRPVRYELHRGRPAVLRTDRARRGRSGLRTPHSPSQQLRRSSTSAPETQIRNVIIDRMAENDAIATRCLKDPEFEEIVFSRLLRRVYDTIWTQETTLDLD